MKKTILISFVSMLLLSACMSTSFIYTGYYHEPLKDEDYIKIVIDDNRDLKYNEIGIIEVRESLGTVDFAQIVNKACDIAKVKGADCIILINRSTSYSGTADAISSTNQYLFKAVKLKHE
ncbi:MAG: hypothetical protein EPN82_10985 [Bacteroidetes bacterium]|nr:MAG: hypothetical protein EPN82_10985 [Bacteroidota bacterium]